MCFGKNHFDDLNRVSWIMLENNLKDPTPTKLTLTGSMNDVLDFRPLQKHKHISDQ